MYYAILNSRIGLLGSDVVSADLLDLTRNRKKQMTTELKYIPLAMILESPEALRGVDKNNESFVGLVESVRNKGIMNAISVREVIDPETEEIVYGLIDGTQRYTAACEVGLDTIPCQVMPCSDAELLEAQIIANVHKVETKPVEYSKALLKILQNNPLLSRSDLANSLNKTGAWISERLGLLKLSEQCAELVDSGIIGLSNAYALAKLDPEEQHDFVERAMTMTPQEFAPTVTARAKEIKDAKRKGKNAAPAEFVPVALLRSRKELIDEMESPQYGPSLCAEVQPTSIDDAFSLGVLWALNLDPQSAEVQRAKEEERLANRAKAKEKSKIERTKKRAQEAADKVAKLQAEAEAETATP